jgi:predicted Zn-dependent peptidase
MIMITMTALAISWLVLPGSIAQADIGSDIYGTPAVIYKMSNGMEVILKENHSSPMITSVVFVRSGAKYETDFNNGVTHFLEHLLFNGTARRSQEEISDRIGNLGGYINAFTRKELTAYMSLVPAAHIAEALDIQQDMLFHSILPEESFPKERGIVIEEIRQDTDDPNYTVDQLLARWNYQGSPYTRPVLGYENLISTISREEVLDYYNTYYQPNNMILLVIGDFEEDSMRDLLEETFGQNPARPIPPRPTIHVPPVRGKTVRQATAAIGETQINFHLRLPVAADPDYLPLLLWSEILSDGALSPLSRNLTEGDAPLATDVSVSMETQEEFAALDITVSTDDPANADSIIAEIEATLRALPETEIDRLDVKNIATRMKVEELFLQEKLHYYAIMRAPTLVVTGYEFIEQLPDRLSQLTMTEMTNAAARHLAPDNYVATVITPEPTETEEAAARPAVRTLYAQRTLANGIPVVVKSNPDSRVFAISILGKNRSAIEPEGRDGISDFVNRMLVAGTETRDADAISRDMAAIGAELTTNDNPYIPYDDFYTTPQYTFIKFATIDEFAADGAELLADLVGRANFPEQEIAKTQRQVMGLLGMAGGSTSQVCRGLFYGSLFGDGPYARPVMGTHQSVAQFTRDDLREHRARLYAPENMQLACVTNLSTNEAFDLLETTFGRLPAGTPASARRHTSIRGDGHTPRVIHRRADRARADGQRTDLHLSGELPAGGIRSRCTSCDGGHPDSLIASRC